MNTSSIRNPQWGNEAFALRYKQIDSLRQYFPILKEINKDSVYEIGIVLPSRKTINLRILLGQDFPYQPPTLQVTPAVQHRFVNEQMIVMPQIHEKLSAWTLHTNLGKTVYEISQKFIQDQPDVLPVSSYPGAYPAAAEPPPPYMSNANPNMAPNPMNSTINQSPAGTPRPQSTSTPAPAPIRPPAIPSSFPELEQKSTAELTDMLTNEEQFRAFFDSLDVVKTMRQIRDDLRDGNEAQAKKNVERVAEIEELKRLVANKKQTLAELKFNLDQKTQRQQQIMQQFAPRVLLERLSDAVTVADNESEAIASAFLDGMKDKEGEGIDEVEKSLQCGLGSSGEEYKEFIKRFSEKRRIYHMRAAKKESMLMSLNR